MAENIQIKINAAVDSAQAATTIGQLRKSLIELQDIAENNDLGAEQFQALQAQIVSTNTDLANARDRIGDIQDKISTLQGTPVERVRNSFGLLKQAIFDLDFDKARIGVEGLTNAFTPLGPDGLPLKGLSAMKGALGNLTGAASQLGTTFINLGRTLLTNPIFLLATVITTIIVGIGLLLNKLGLLEPIFDAIGKAVEYVTDSFNQLTESIGINTAATDKNLKATLAAEQEKRKALEETLQVQEAVAEAAKGLNSQEQKDIEKISGAYLRSGKDIVDIRNEALNKIKISLQEEAKAYEDVAKTKRKLTNEEKKSYDEIVLKIAETNTKIAALNAERVRQTNELREQNRLNSIALEEDELTRAKLLRDEEIRIAKSNQDQLNELSRKAEEAEEAALNKRKMAYTQAMFDEADAEIEKAKQIRAFEQENIKKRDIAIADANAKFNKTQQQLQEEAARKSQDNFQKRVKFELEELKRKGEAELLDAEGFELKQLEIKNKYIKLTEEFQLRNTKVFFESELQKNNFIKNNAQQILDNNIKIGEIEQKRQELLEEAGFDARQAELTSIANQDRTLVGLEKELADNRILLTITRDRFDLEIKQAERALNTLKNSQGAAEKQKEIAAAELNLATLKINAETELGIIKESIRKIDQEAIIRVQAERANDIQAEINALQTLLNEKIKVDDATLSSREETIKLVEELETASEERLKELRGLSVEGQIDLLNRIEQKKKEQIASDELTLRLERSNIEDFSDFETQLAALSVAEQKEFNASRLENEKTTSDAVIAIRQEEARQKEEIEERQKQFIINTATTTISALQTISDIFYAGRLRKVQGNAVEEEKIARKQFQVNKALNLSTATMTGIISVMEAYKNGLKNPIPLLGPLTGTVYAGLAAAVSAINIAKIAATTFNSKGGAASAGSAPTQNINGAAPEVTGLPTQFSPPTFFGLGEGTQQTMTGPNQQRVYVLESDITSTQNKVSVIENRATIQ